MSQHSRSNETHDEPKQPHPWLLKHYREKRERTVRLVKATIDHLIKEGQKVTLEAICLVSPTLDSESRGVKKSSILENPEAHAYYRQHSVSYQVAQNHKRGATRKGQRAARPSQPLRINPKRDVDRTRYRYLQMTKLEIVERLLFAEQAYAESQQQLAGLQFELLSSEQRREEEKLRTRHS